MSDAPQEPTSAAELEAWMRGHARWFFDMDSWLDYMAGMEFSVGARLHSPRSLHAL